MNNMSSTKLGISTYCFPYAIGVPGFEPKQMMSVFDLIDQAVKLQVSVVQIADNLPLHKLSRQELEHLGRYAARSGIDIEVGTRGIKTAHLLKYIQIAEILHSKLIRVVVDTADHKPEIEEIVELIRLVLPQLAEKGIVLGIENHDRFKAEAFAEIIKLVNSPWVGIVLDTVNSFACQENTQTVLDTLAEYTVNFHVKDFKIARAKNNMGLLVTGTPAGKGVLNVPEMLKRLKKEAKTDFSTILEFWMEPAPTPEESVEIEGEWIRESISYLKRFF